jgi:hypothetical protein
MPARAAPAAPAAPAVAPQPPRCTCRRSTGVYEVYCGPEPTVEYTLTYPCPGCGKQVVEHGYRLKSVCTPLPEA